MVFVRAWQQVNFELNTPVPYKSLKKEESRVYLSLSILPIPGWSIEKRPGRTHSSIIILIFPSFFGTVKLVTPSCRLNVIVKRLPPIRRFDRLTWFNHLGRVGLLIYKIFLGAFGVSPRIDWRIMKIAPAAQA